MNIQFTVTGLKTGIIVPGDDITEILLKSLRDTGLTLQDGDVMVIAENAVATAEGALVTLSENTPSPKALQYADTYGMNPHLAEAVIQESDTVIGGIPGFLLCMKNGTLLPNAGIDGSNAPEGTVVCLPRDPNKSAESIRDRIHEMTGCTPIIIIADSRTHAMRLGCSGVAIGCAGTQAVVDEVGKEDLFGRELEVTKKAVADNLASAAELVMGEAGESVPAAIIQGLSLPMEEISGIPDIAAEECLFMGAALNANPAMFK
ncbi:coenzyme F420-0:L-glutamate ligase [Methanogenium organophilum]|uniref:Coenzyme F420-0:L-glutamate ligase n=1 Tax=Methanogenium organophilum TaxID=2199 RepID=A0A9X9S4G0_METOG|nr:coenzyme F420-0:L-glutamate ligase [Methanogenium organophilum]WAI01305.1 coenzyme F420-0:L-glutamate ligase [Methanogenium organophilum]